MRLRRPGVGFTEVLPLERVLESPQARQPGKLRDIDFRGLDFEVPEFPGQREIAASLPPPELGEHTLEVLRTLGYDEGECAMLLEHGAVLEAAADAFAYAPVREKGQGQS